MQKEPHQTEYSSHYEKFLATGEVRCIDDEIPFDIPDTWEWVRLRMVATIARGGSPRPIQEYLTNDTSGINWIKIGDTEKDGKYINSTKEKIKLEGASRSRIIHKGDFLLTNSMSFGRPYISNIEGCIHDGWLVISPIKESFNQDFLYYLLSSAFAYSQFCGIVSGAVVKNLNTDKVAEALFPIPPTNEQQRIVKAIEKYESYIERYKIAQNTLDRLNSTIKERLQKSILQEAIQGKLVPQIAEESTAEELLKRIQEEKKQLVKQGKLKAKDLTNSHIFRGDDNKYYEQIGDSAVEIESDFVFPDSWAVVRLADICRLTDGEKKQGEYVCLDAKFLRGKSIGSQMNRGKFVTKGDTIILVDGENSGEVFTTPCEGYMGSTFKQLWVSKEMYLPYVLSFVQFYKDHLRNSKKGAAIPHLNKDIFCNLLIGIPPKQEQQRISTQIKALYSRL